MSSDMAITLSSVHSRQSYKADVEDLIFSAMMERSNNIYSELEGLTAQMKQRNNTLGTLGSLLAAVQGQIPSDQTKTTDISKVTFHDPTTGRDVTLKEYFKEHPELNSGKVDLTKASSSDLQSLVTSITTKQDQLNNDSQADTLRLQSMTSAYNKCFDMTSNVLSKASATKQGIVSNIRS